MHSTDTESARGANDPARGVLILLVQHADFRSQAGVALTGGFFSHASIGLASDPTTFYSFAYKGFRVERTGYLAEHTPAIPCHLYRIPCTARQELKLRWLFRAFQRQKSRLKFNGLGLLLAYLHIPVVRQKRFFCSQFVATALNRACRIGTPEWARTCLPDGLTALPAAELIFQGTARELAGAAA